MVSKRVEIKPAIVGDVYALAPRLREEDVREAKEIWGVAPESALITSYNESSESWSVFCRGKIIAMFGRVDYKWGAAPWLVGSPELTDHKLLMSAKVSEVLKEWQGQVNILRNSIDARNTSTIAWLERIGFSIRDQEAHSPNGMRVAIFEWRHPLCVSQD